MIMMTDGATPDLYSDVFAIHVNPWSAVVDFGLRALSTEEQNVVVVRVRMSPQHAKAVALLLLRTVRKYEADQGVNIAIPPVILRELGIPPEDWTQFGVGGQ